MVRQNIVKWLTCIPVQTFTFPFSDEDVILAGLRPTQLREILNESASTLLRCCIWKLTDINFLFLFKRREKENNLYFGSKFSQNSFLAILNSKFANEATWQRQYRHIYIYISYDLCSKHIQDTPSVLLISDDLPIKVWAPEIMLLLWDLYLLLRMSQLLAFSFWGKELKISMSCNTSIQKSEKK